ncbi:hypothetical protein GCM10027447_18500 [Glycomyces halotolerans]
MPTITIETGPLKAARRRAIAVRLTRWLAENGVAPERAIVRFAEADPALIHSGAMPLDALADAAAERPFAWVTCCIAPDRDEAFRAALAEQITAALGVSERTTLCYIEFRPTPPSLVHLVSGGTTTRADRPRAASSEGK